MIKIYTTPTCVFCEMIKEYLKEKKIAYKEYDVSKDEKAQEEMIKKTNQYGVPVIDINGKIITGFDKVRLEELLEKQKAKPASKTKAKVKAKTKGKSPKAKSKAKKRK